MKIDIASTWMPEDLLSADIWIRIYDLADVFYGFGDIHVSVKMGTYRFLCSENDGYICHTVMRPIPGWYDRVSELEEAIERYKTEVTDIFATKCEDVVRLDEPSFDVL